MVRNTLFHAFLLVLWVAFVDGEQACGEAGAGGSTYLGVLRCSGVAPRVLGSGGVGDTLPCWLVGGCVPDPGRGSFLPRTLLRGA